MNIIKSNQNNLVKKLKLLSTKKGRGRFAEFIVEGRKYIPSVELSWEISQIVMSESYFRENGVEDFQDVFVLQDNIFANISDTVTPQGILAVVKKREFSVEDILSSGKKSFIVVAHDLQDPGNLGTLIRTADACGACGVIVTKGTADIYNPKVVRSTSGSLFHIPVICMEFDECIESLNSCKINTVATSLRGEITPFELDLKSPCAIIIGNEAKGLDEEDVKKCRSVVKLPMIGKAESLNASVASGVLMYEVLRQRMYNKS